jgi:hypothetical protein
MKNIPRTLGVKKELCLFYKFNHGDGLLCFPFE